MMNNTIKFAAALALAAMLPTTALANQPVDDGPCPAGTYGYIPAGSDYANDVWTNAAGEAFGTAPEEDQCWTPLTPWAANVPTQPAAPAAEPARLPATR